MAEVEVLDEEIPDELGKDLATFLAWEFDSPDA